MPAPLPRHPFGEEAEDQRRPLVVRAHHQRRRLGVRARSRLWSPIAPTTQTTMPGSGVEPVREPLAATRVSSTSNSTVFTSTPWRSAMSAAVLLEAGGVAGGERHRMPVGRETVRDGEPDVGASAEDQDGICHRRSLSDWAEAKVRSSPASRRMSRNVPARASARCSVGGRQPCVLGEVEPPAVVERDRVEPVQKRQRPARWPESRAPACSPPSGTRTGSAARRGASARRGTNPAPLRRSRTAAPSAPRCDASSGSAHWNWTKPRRP